MRRTNITSGLTSAEVEENRRTYGSNILASKEQESFFRQLLTTLGDPIIRILLIALGIKTVFLIQDFDWYETIGIVIAIFLASFISTISEYGSEQAFKKLQEESSKIKCRVRRDGKIIEINIDEIVVGDIVLLQSGDKVPADGILIQGAVTVDESSLNGETKEQHKLALKDYQTPNENHWLYRGTVIYAQEGTLCVQKVGKDTFYGKLAEELQDQQPESPLKLRLRHLAKIISRIGYCGAILVSVSYLFSVIVLANHFDLVKIQEMITNFPLITGHLLYALTLSVTIIVVAVPEGLPMMITLVLSSNMKRMLKNHVLVRKLVGIETAGSVNILFTDKTGTLTKGKLEVVQLYNGTLKSYADERALRKDPNYFSIVYRSMIYNNASNYDEIQKKVIGGNTTDRALFQFFDHPKKDCKMIKTQPFDSKNKYSISLIDGEKDPQLIKGAPEKILPFCDAYYNEEGKRMPLYSKRAIEKAIGDATKQGIRVLVMATSSEKDIQSSFRHLTLVGILFIKDEIRKEAIEGVRIVKNAHIQTVMITGDNKDTAVSIAREVGLIERSDEVVLTSSELAMKSDEEVGQLLPKLRVVARALPQDKSRLVKISQARGMVVAMTGDGVNDAPALKKADVGFAMGSGTEVSKEASDIVILDDNFLSISKAILFGRTIFKSIRKFIIFQLTVNFCAISMSIVGPFIGVDTPVTVIQMLWINMVMDTLAGIAFAYEPPLAEYMMEQPKKREEAILNRYMLNQILVTGLYSSILCILFLKLPFFHTLFRLDPSDKYFLTGFFGLFIFIGIFNSFNARTHRLNLLAHLFQNRVFLVTIAFIIVVQIFLIYYGGDLFRTAGLTLRELEIMILLAFTVVPFDWLRKIYLRFHGVQGGG